GADVLGRDDCGQIAAGKRADLAIWDMSGIEAAGNWDIAALLMAGPTQVRDLFIEGRRVVAAGQLTSIDLPKTIARQNQLAGLLSA
ncbi:MAG TPA: 8-oxoguanine deaminase, partial [Rhodobacteraceae bacterium]|nr:8-oxoguanine deaminase [Paracoccaceae bacterium]